MTAALLALWFGLLKPTIESQAKAAAQESADQAAAAAALPEGAPRYSLAELRAKAIAMCKDQH